MSFFSFSRFLSFDTFRHLQLCSFLSSLIAVQSLWGSPHAASFVPGSHKKFCPLSIQGAYSPSYAINLSCLSYPVVDFIVWCLRLISTLFPWTYICIYILHFFSVLLFITQYLQAYIATIRYSLVYLEFSFTSDHFFISCPV